MRFPLDLGLHKWHYTMAERRTHARHCYRCGRTQVWVNGKWQQPYSWWAMKIEAQIENEAHG